MLATKTAYITPGVNCSKTTERVGKTSGSNVDEIMLT